MLSRLERLYIGERPPAILPYDLSLTAWLRSWTRSDHRRGTENSFFWNPERSEGSILLGWSFLKSRAERGVHIGKIVPSLTGVHTMNWILFVPYVVVAY